MTTEQEVIDLFYPNDNTKTISNVIEDLRVLQNGAYTTEQSQNEIKSAFPDISDWSF